MQIIIHSLQFCALQKLCGKSHDSFNGDRKQLMLLTALLPDSVLPTQKLNIGQMQNNMAAMPQHTVHSGGKECSREWHLGTRMSYNISGFHLHGGIINQTRAIGEFDHMSSWQCTLSKV